MAQDFNTFDKCRPIIASIQGFVQALISQFFISSILVHTCSKKVLLSDMEVRTVNL